MSFENGTDEIKTNAVNVANLLKCFFMDVLSEVEITPRRRVLLGFVSYKQHSDFHARQFKSIKSQFNQRVMF